MKVIAFCGPLLILLANESEVVGWKTNNEVDDAEKIILCSGNIRWLKQIVMNSKLEYN
jgi:hypothetical protein